MTKENNSDYIDLYTEGMGYINQIREVPSKQGPPFWSVKIAALRGHVDNVKHTYFECVVVGEEAKDLVRQLQYAVEAEFKVLVGFLFSDLYAEAFIFKTGAHAGKAGVNLKTKLLRFEWIKVNGKPFPAQQEAVA